MFGRKQQRGGPQFTTNPALEKEFNLLENFAPLCINKCLIQDEIEKDLQHEEKVCIGKCMDRSYEYLRILENTRK